MLVDRGVFLDVRVRARHVGLRLVVVVIGDEILDGIAREELPHLAVELRGQRLVGCQNDRRSLRALDHVGHRVGLARTRNAKQDLLGESVAQALDQPINSLTLVAGRRILRHESARSRSSLSRSSLRAFVLGADVDSRTMIALCAIVKGNQ